MTQRVGADAPDADVAILLIDDGVLALVLDVRQLELLAEDLRELVERQLHLEGVLSRVLAGLALAITLLALALTDAVPRLALPLPDTALLLVGEPEARDVDVGDGDRHDVVPLLAHELALGDVFLEVLPDFPAHDIAKARVVLVDFQGHADSIAACSARGATTRCIPIEGAALVRLTRR